MQFNIRKKHVRSYTVEVASDIDDLIEDAVNINEEDENYQGERHMTTFTVSIDIECVRGNFQTDDDEYECERVD